MARSLGNMTIHLGLDAKGVQKGAEQAQNVIIELRDKVSGLGGLLSGALGGLSLSGVAGWGVKLAAEAETAQVAFEVMLGSADKATSMLASLKSFSASTPFEFTELQDATKTLLAFGIQGENILPTLQMLGDVAGGNAQKLQSLALVFGQVASSGKLTGGDLLQLINVGFNPLQIIAEKTGKSMGELKDQMSKGLITFGMVQEAFKIATTEGGLFFGMMDKMSKTLGGRWSTLKDNAAALATEIGTQLLPVIGRLIDTASTLLEMLKGVNAETVAGALKITAMTAAFAASMTVIPRLIAMIGGLVKAMRAFSMSQAIAQALSGPKGWATLAVSLAVAAGAGYAVTKMFEEQQQTVAAATEQTGKLAKVNGQLGESFKALAGDATKVDAELEKLKTRAASLAESLRTPAEVFKDTMAELVNLQERGLLSVDNYVRGVIKAKEELQQASKAARDLSVSGNVQVGAAERFTSGGFSAVQQGRQDQQRQIELARQQLEEERRTNELLTEIRDRPAGVILREARL